MFFFFVFLSITCCWWSSDGHLTVFKDFLSTVFLRIVSALKYFPLLNSFCTFIYCNQRSQCIRQNSKKNSFRRNYSRKYGKHKVKPDGHQTVIRVSSEGHDGYLSVISSLIIFSHYCHQIQGKSDIFVTLRSKKAWNSKRNHTPILFTKSFPQMS